MNKRVLVIGSGGREHALAWTLARSPQIEQVYVAPGNGGTEWPANPAAQGLQPRAAAQNVALPGSDFPGLIAFAQANQVDLIVVGPEVPLAAGIVDAFQATGLQIWGPSQAAAQMEGSKAFSKDFMQRHGIPTADYRVFEDFDAACAYVDAVGAGVVVKADGLTGGKGVLIRDSADEIKAALHELMVEQIFGDAGRKVVVEARMIGREISVLAFSDGKTVVPMPVARDHKRAYDNDEGPNTGGMGAFTPTPDVEPVLIEWTQQNVLQPTIDGMAAEGMPYVGVLYAGLMLTDDGPQVLEFNCRFGDPEAQVILPLLKTDLYAICAASIVGELDKLPINWCGDTCATIVLASPGYPGDYPTGLPIAGMATAAARTEIIVFHAGTAWQDDQLVTSGGRVMAITALGNDLSSALRQAYTGIDLLNFENMHYRHDIGQKFLAESVYQS